VDEGAQGPGRAAAVAEGQGRVLKTLPQKQAQYQISFHFKFCTSSPPTLLLMGRKGFLRYSTFILFSLLKLFIPSSYKGVLVIRKPNYFFKIKKLVITYSCRP